MKHYLILKLNSTETLSSDEIKKRATKEWKINPKRLDNVDEVIVLQQLQCIAVFKIGPKIEYDRDTKRITFQELTEIKSSDFLNKKFDYNTSNPATIATEDKLRKVMNNLT